MFSRIVSAREATGRRNGTGDRSAASRNTVRIVDEIVKAVSNLFRSADTELAGGLGAMPWTARAKCIADSAAFATVPLDILGI